MTGKQLVSLTQRVVKSFTASDWQILATLRDADDLVFRGDRLLRSQRFGDDDYESEALAAIKRLVDADDANAPALIEYLDHKYPDGSAQTADLISSRSSSARKLIFAPLVFDVPASLPDPRLISVMMPFGVATRPTYNAIKAAAANAGFVCKRADNIWEHSTVIQDVFSLIYSSFVVVCDFSGRNPNVFYEAGIAHALGKHVVPITQSLDDVPFDLRHHRHAKYLDNDEGRGKLTAELTNRLKTLATERDK